jgi:ABC-type sugar transport system ATPase subunit
LPRDSNETISSSLSAYENITFGLKGKVPNNEIDSTVAPIVSLLEIEDVVKLRPDQLSGGQRQRVALARPLALGPKLLMLDEPMSNLDPELRDRVRLEMRRFFKKLGATTLYVTHDLADAFALGDKVAVLMNGEIRAMESPQQLLKSPRAIEVGRFLGLNCFKAKVVSRTCVDINGLQLSTAELPVEAGRDVIVSFRSDCLRPMLAETVVSPNVLTGTVLEILPSVETVNLRINVLMRDQVLFSSSRSARLDMHTRPYLNLHAQLGRPAYHHPIQAFGLSDGR